MEPEARGVTDISQSELGNKKPDQNANFEDDLFLGAEGKVNYNFLGFDKVGFM